MLRKFYEAVLPQSGHFCLFMLPKRAHVWANSVEQLVVETELRRDEQGVYFAVESFGAPDNRTQANTLALRSLRLDVDAGAEKFGRNPDGAYATRTEALAALRGFFVASAIAPSHVVSSGEGWHVYYCLNQDITPAQWLPLARRLDILCKAHGLRIDASVTCDWARVLRPLGSLHKNGQRVTLVADTGVRYGLEELLSTLPEAPAPARAYDMSVNADLRPITPPKSIAKILERCGAMQQVNAVKGDVPEPFWRAMLGVVKHTVEGLDAAHELSRGHSGYDPQDTERKFNAWATGPTTCAEIGKHTDACLSCDYQGKVKSPILLGLMTEPEIAELPLEKQPLVPLPPPPTGDPWDGCIPARFEVIKGTPNTLVYKMKVDKETESGDTVQITVAVPFTHDIFWLGEWAEAEGSDDLAQVTLNLFSGGRVKRYTFDQSLAAGKSEMLKYLAGRAIHLTSNKRAGAAMDDYIKAELLRIKGIGQRPKINDRLGMRILENGELVAVHGKYFIKGDGYIQEAMLGKGPRSIAERFPLPLPASFTGQWEPSVWPTILHPAASRYVEFMKRYYRIEGLEKYQLAIMMGLASPFMAFVTSSYHRGDTLPPSGFTVSLLSTDTGKGKTAVVAATMMAYGSRVSLVKDSNRSGTTDIARNSKLSLWGTMPMSMDEMGEIREDATAEMIKMVANGSAKERSTKEGGLSFGAPWALMNMITTNRSQRDMIAANGVESPAVQTRLLELNVENVAQFGSDVGGAVDTYDIDIAAIDRTCAGAFGAAIEYWMCQQGPAKVNRVVAHYVAQSRQLLGLPKSADRFQYRALGAVLTIQSVATSLGLAMFDTATLVAEFKAAYEAGNEFISDTHAPAGGPDLLAKMLAEVRHLMVVTENETHLGHDRSRFDQPVNQRVPDKPVARHVISTGVTYISTSVFRDWCTKSKVSEREIISSCRKLDILMQFKSVLNTGKDHYTEYFDFNKGMRDNASVRSRSMKVDTRKLLRHIGAEWDSILPEIEGNVVALGRSQGAPAPVSASASAAVSS